MKRLATAGLAAVTITVGIALGGTASAADEGAPGDRVAAFCERADDIREHITARAGLAEQRLALIRERRGWAAEAGRDRLVERLDTRIARIEEALAKLPERLAKLDAVIAERCPAA